MAGVTGLTLEQIEANLNKLILLHGDVQRMRDRVTTLRGQQTSNVWPAITGVAEFADQYRSALSASATRIRGVEEEIEACRLALAESARSLQARDEAEAERLQALAKRLETVRELTTAHRMLAV
ncbi:hypothetical protein [Cellulomonas sp. NPDC058312]|uniref:hypothetical protein n=1 Tax=Cellulomonas sp. NPDC058312 TaxID=3346441 RepID=UPI0036EA8D91